MSDKRDKTDIKLKEEVFPIRIGAIDLGSNSVRLVIGELRDKEIIKLVHRSRIIRLIEGVEGGYLKPEYRGKLLQVIAEYGEVCAQNNVRSVHVLATEVFRKLGEEERNALSKEIEEKLKEFVAKAKVEVLSESEEARYIFLALMDHADEFAGIVDIGGGSIDIGLPYLSSSFSLKLGTLRIKELVDRRGENYLEDKISAYLNLTNLREALKATDKPLVFAGGDPVTIALLIKEPESLEEFFQRPLHQVSIRELQELRKRIEGLSEEELGKLLKVDSARAKTIPYALTFMIKLNQILSKEKALITPLSILDGFLKEKLASLRDPLTSIMTSMLCSQDATLTPKKLVDRLINNLVDAEGYELITYDPIMNSLRILEDNSLVTSYPIPGNLSPDMISSFLALPFCLKLNDYWRKLLKEKLALHELPLNLRDYNYLLKLDMNGNFLGFLFLRLRDSANPTMLFILKQLLSNYLMMTALYKASMIDPLTSAYNRRFLFDKLLDEVKRAIRYKIPLSIALLDLDNFKEINDTYGHSVGDQALRELARFLMEHTRKGIDIVARYGGDEIVILLPHTALEGAIHCCMRLSSEVSSRKFTPLRLKLIGSWGISCIHPKEEFKISNQPDYDSLRDKLLSEADKAMYHAKKVRSLDPKQKVFVSDPNSQKVFPATVYLAKLGLRLRTS